MKKLTLFCLLACLAVSVAALAEEDLPAPSTGESAPIEAPPAETTTANAEPTPAAAAPAESPAPEVAATEEKAPEPAAPAIPAPAPTPVAAAPETLPTVSYDDDEAIELRSLQMHENGRWQVGFAFVSNPFSEYDFDPDATIKKNLKLWGVTGSLLVFPIVSLGRWGLGFSYTWTRRESEDLIYTGLSPAFLAYGAMTKYELQYWTGQTLVPFAIAGYDKVKTHFSARGIDVHDNFNSPYYGGGVALNLNSLEKQVASRSLNSTGVKKFYLDYTYQYRHHSTLARKGGAHLIGLRFEF